MAELDQLLHDHFDDPYHRGPCDCPTHAASLSDVETGCQLAFELSLDGEGVVQQIWFEAEGCEVCEGLASWLASTCEGLTAAEIRELCLGDVLKQHGHDANRVCQRSACATLPLLAIKTTLCRSLHDSGDQSIDGDLSEGTQFGGPSLREEC